MKRVTITEARATLPDIVFAVQRGEEVVITRHGQAIAIVLDPDRYFHHRSGAMRADAERIHELLEGAGAAPLPSHAPLTAQRAEELVAAIRAGRDVR